MILLNALPQKWDHIASVYIQETEVNDFNLVKIREQIMGEWEHSNAGKASTSANKLSAVKRKGKSPQFNSQKQNANDNKAEDSGRTDNKRSKCGKKKPRTEKSSGHNHLHLASVGALVPPPPPLAPVVYLWAKDIPVRGRASKSRPTLVLGLVVYGLHLLYVAQHYCLHYLQFSVPLCVSKYLRPS